MLKWEEMEKTFSDKYLFFALVGPDSLSMGSSGMDDTSQADKLWWGNTSTD